MMAIEIGSLVVKGHFGPTPRNSDMDRADMARQIAELRRDILEDVREMIADASPRMQDR